MAESAPVSSTEAAPAPAPVSDTVDLDVDGQVVEVDPPGPRRWVRHPGDVIRLVVALLATAGAWVVLEWGRRTSEGLQDDVAAAEPDLPGIVLKVLYGSYGVLLLALPVALFVWVISRRHWRLFLLYWATTATTNVVLSLLSGIIDDRVPNPPAGAADLGASLSLWELEDYSAVASFAAALTVTGPWISRRWYRLGWILLLLLLPVRLLVGAGVPSGRMFALALGWAIGAAFLVIFGSPTRAPSAASIVRGMRSSGTRLSALRRAGVDARGSTPYFAQVEDGSRLFVKTLGRDERSADLMFRVYRYLTLNNVGDEEPFSSLRRAVEHEAMTSVWAQRAGVRTPNLVACVELEDGSMALAYAMV